MKKHWKFKLGHYLDFAHFVDEREQVIKFYPTIKIEFMIETMKGNYSVSNKGKYIAESIQNLFTKLNDLYLNHRKIKISISDLNEK